MEMGRKKGIMIVIILFACTTFAVGAQQGWFNFILVPDLSSTDLELQEDFILTGVLDSQELFQVSVTISGSGNTGQEQQVSVTIEHNRIDGGYWEADGFYVLALEEMDGSPVDTIDSGAFTDLREYESYVKPLIWIPSADPKLYMMILRIYDVTWDEYGMSMGNYSEVNTALEINTENCSGWDGTLIEATFNVTTSLIITPGSTVYAFTKIECITSVQGLYYSYHFEVERVGGGDRHQVGTNVIRVGPFGDTLVVQPNGHFIAEGGDWTFIIVIDYMGP